MQQHKTTVAAIILGGACTLGSANVLAGAMSGAFAHLLWDTLSIDAGENPPSFTSETSFLSVIASTDISGDSDDQNLPGWIDQRLQALVPNASATAWTGDEFGLGIYDEIAASTDLSSAGAPNLSGYVAAKAERSGEFTYVGSTAAMITLMIDYFLEVGATAYQAGASAGALASVELSLKNETTDTEIPDYRDIWVSAPALGGSDDSEGGSLQVSLLASPGDRITFFAASYTDGYAQIPLPATISLLVLGLFGLGVARRRR